MRLHAAVQGPRSAVRKYKDKGLEVLGFPCNQFGAQEPGNEEEIATFCEMNYGVTFPLFAKVDVNGDAAAPLYQYLKSAKPGLLGTEAIKWNFTKFLVDRERQRRRALRAERHAGIDRRATSRRRCSDARGSRGALAVAATLLLAAAPAVACGAGRARQDAARRRFRSPRPASIRRRPATSIRTTSIARSSIRSTATTTSRDRTSSFRTRPPRMPEISADGKTWTIRVRPGIYFADDPAFKGQQRELTAADYVYRVEAHARSADALELAADVRRALRRRRRAGREGEGDRASSTTTRRSKACRRSTATRCSSSSMFADYELLSNLTTVRRRPRSRARSSRRTATATAGRWPIRSAPDRTGSRTGGAASSIVLEANPGFRDERYPASHRPRRPRRSRRLDGPQAAARSARVEISIIEESQSAPARVRAGRARLRWPCRPTSCRTCSTPDNQLEAALREGRACALARGVQPAITYTYFNMDDPVVGGYTPAQDRAAPRDRHGATTSTRRSACCAQGQGAAGDAVDAAEHDRLRPDVRRARQVRPRRRQGAARQVRLRRSRRRRLARHARRQAARAEDGLVDERARPRSTTSCGSAA